MNKKIFKNAFVPFSYETFSESCWSSSELHLFLVSVPGRTQTHCSYRYICIWCVHECCILNVFVLPLESFYCITFAQIASKVFVNAVISFWDVPWLRLGFSAWDVSKWLSWHLAGLGLKWVFSTAHKTWQDDFFSSIFYCFSPQNSAKAFLWV